MPRKAKSASTAPLSGITVAVSGKLSLDRKKLTALVEGAGGAVASSVTKKVLQLNTADQVDNCWVWLWRSRDLVETFFGHRFFSS
jgi:hypothetical protein